MPSSAPTKSIVDSPTSIRCKSRARLWSIEGGRGNHLKGFPGLFFLLPGVFFLEKQKENAVRFPFSRKEKEKNWGAKWAGFRSPQTGPLSRRPVVYLRLRHQPAAGITPDTSACSILPASQSAATFGSIGSRASTGRLYSSAISARLLLPKISTCFPQSGHWK